MATSSDRSTRRKGTAWPWTSRGSLYLGQNTVRKYDPKTGKMLMEVPARSGERQRQAVRRCRPSRSACRVGQRRSSGRVHRRQDARRWRPRRPRWRGGGGGDRRDASAAAAGGLHRQVSADHADDRRAASRRFAPTMRPTRFTSRTTPSAAASWCSSMDTFAFKRGWGAYGHKLSEISTKTGRSRLHAGRPDGQGVRRPPHA